MAKTEKKKKKERKKKCRRTLRNQLMEQATKWCQFNQGVCYANVYVCVSVFIFITGVAPQADLNCQRLFTFVQLEGKWTTFVAVPYTSAPSPPRHLSIPCDIPVHHSSYSWIVRICSSGQLQNSTIAFSCSSPPPARSLRAQCCNVISFIDTTSTSIASVRCADLCTCTINMSSVVGRRVRMGSLFGLL